MLAAVETRYLMRPVGEADLALVRGWRAAPHVLRWWGDPAAEPEGEALGERTVALWIAELEGRPFAFIQDYDVHAWSPHHFDFLPRPFAGLRPLICINHPRPWRRHRWTEPTVNARLRGRSSPPC